MMGAGEGAGWRVRDKIAAGEIAVGAMAVGLGVRSAFFSQTAVAGDRAARTLEELAVEQLRLVIAGMGSAGGRRGNPAPAGDGPYSQILRELAVRIVLDPLPIGRTYHIPQQNDPIYQQVRDLLHGGDPETRVAELNRLVKSRFKGHGGPLLTAAIDRAVDVMGLLENIEAGRAPETGTEILETGNYETAVVIDHSARNRFGDIFARTFGGYGDAERRLAPQIEAANRMAITGGIAAVVGAFVLVDALVVFISPDGQGFEGSLQ